MLGKGPLKLLDVAAGGATNIYKTGRAFGAGKGVKPDLRKGKAEIGFCTALFCHDHGRPFLKVRKTNRLSEDEKK
ncbi:hypothetical protein KL919_000566 [Ogataea angusta]|nr:hypothetical protein KL919_000566 [Ogataea angusta]